MTRILILSAGVGGGHNRAAEALHETARAQFPGVETAWVDSLCHANKVFARLYERSYFWTAGYAPELWGLLYKRMSRNVERKKLQKVVELHDRLAYRKLMDQVEEFRPDAVVCTHFLPANVVVAHTEGALPVYVMVTDFDVHSFWINKRAAGYFVASDEVKWQLGRFGYPLDRIRVTGIPIHPVFGRDIRPRKAERPTLLFMSGGFGMGHMERALERILAIDLPFRLIVVAGRNEKMKTKLEALAGSRAAVHGFVTNIHDLMDEADLIITKAGGLTVSECLARHRPMILFAPIPGQEECNADYLLEKGAAVKARSLEVLDFKVKEVLETPGRLDMMGCAAASVARPRAAGDLLRHVLDENPGG